MVNSAPEVASPKFPLDAYNGPSAPVLPEGVEALGEVFEHQVVSITPKTADQIRHGRVGDIVGVPPAVLAGSAGANGVQPSESGDYDMQLPVFVLIGGVPTPISAQEAIVVTTTPKRLGEGTHLTDLMLSRALRLAIGVQDHLGNSSDLSTRVAPSTVRFCVARINGKPAILLIDQRIEEAPTA
ncbi:MAG: hypothetical protein WCT46_05665 [Candidatus Gracilibacteria bacterium]|jgi:hypothetical protein